MRDDAVLRRALPLGRGLGRDATRRGRTRKRDGEGPFHAVSGPATATRVARAVVAVLSAD